MLAGLAFNSRSSWLSFLSAKVRAVSTTTPCGIYCFDCHPSSLWCKWSVVSIKNSSLALVSMRKTTKLMSSKAGVNGYLFYSSNCLGLSLLLLLFFSFFLSFVWSLIPSLRPEITSKFLAQWLVRSVLHKIPLLFFLLQYNPLYFLPNCYHFYRWKAILAVINLKGLQPLLCFLRQSCLHSLSQEGLL